jgi:hypothetical protein
MIRIKYQHWGNTSETSETSGALKDGFLHSGMHVDENGKATVLISDAKTGVFFRQSITDVFRDTDTVQGDLGSTLNTLYDIESYLKYIRDCQ